MESCCVGLGALGGCCVCWRFRGWFGVSVRMGKLGACMEWKEAVTEEGDTGALRLSLKDRF